MFFNAGSSPMRSVLVSRSLDNSEIGVA